MLPANGLQSKVKIVGRDRVDRRAVVDLVGVVIKDAMTELMANMARYADPSTSSFRSVAQLGIGLPVVDSLVEVEAQENADVSPLSSGKFSGNTTNTFCVDVVEEVTGVL